MQTNQLTLALVWTPSSPLLVFFDPAFIGLNAEGKNLGDEALIVHEALHGLTNLTDIVLQDRLGVSGPRCSIDQAIQIWVLAFAPNLNPQRKYDCPP